MKSLWHWVPLINSYVIENGVCYLTLTEKTFSKRAAFSFLEELSSEFQREFGSRVPTATRPYSFIEFGEWLKRGNAVLLKVKAKPPKLKKQQQMFLVQNLVKKKECGIFLYLLFPIFFIIGIWMLCFCVTWPYPSLKLVKLIANRWAWKLAP